jgi:hypothetical protein
VSGPKKLWALGLAAGTMGIWVNDGWVCVQDHPKTPEPTCTEASGSQWLNWAYWEHTGPRCEICAAGDSR